MTKKKKKDKTICLTEGQIKTLLDEDREGNVCETARELIDEVDEKYESERKKKGKNKESSALSRFMKEWL